MCYNISTELLGGPMIDQLITLLDKLPKELIVFILSMTPIIELRGGIPAAYAMGLPLFETLPIAIIGNILPVPFILLFIKHIFKFLRDHGVMTKIIDKVTHRAMQKSDNVEAMEFWGLLLFVAIPLPGTGAWTGALIASLLNIKFKKAMFAISAGVIISATIVSLLTYGLLNIII